MDLTDCDALVLSGGGIKILAALGALDFLVGKGLDLSKVRWFSGTSAGFISCALLAAGYSPAEILSMLISQPLFELADINPPHLLMANLGILSTDRFFGRIREKLADRLGLSPTLAEFQELTGRSLCASATNVSKRRVERYDPEASPDLECVEAAKRSSGLPLIFDRIVVDGDTITDGGLLEALPTLPVDDGARKILAVLILGGGLPDELFGKGAFFDSAYGRAAKETIEYIYSLLTLPSGYLTAKNAEALGPNVSLIVLRPKEVSILDVTLSRERKMGLFLYGRSVARFETRMRRLKVQGWTC